jgi:CubicO group peptidase (beta-lactamase class C family)
LFILSGCKKDHSPLDFTVDLPWESASPESQNINEDLLSQLTADIVSDTYGEIHSLLIIRNDKLVYEQYFEGYGREDLHYIYSVTKSFTSALIGIALNDSFVDSLNIKVAAYFPKYTSSIDTDPRKHEISLSNLLTMSAGFTWDESTYPYDHPLNDIYRLLQSADWMQFMWQLPMSYAPGTLFNYNSGCTMILSGIIKQTTGLTAEEYAEKYLFLKLDIKNWRWETGPHRITNTGWGLHLTPVDMAKLGYLYLKKGDWFSQRVLPESWVHESTTTRISINNSYNYGYQWWRFTDQSSVAGQLSVNDLFFAWGYGGQFIFVFPHLDLLIVSTAANFDDSRPTIRFVRDFILPATRH